MKKIWNQRKKWLIMIAVLALIFFFWQYEKKESAMKQAKAEKEAQLLAAPKEEKKKAASGQNGAQSVQNDIVVDIKGEVKHPGVYTLTTGLRVNDAIHRAGGFTSKADEEQINLAQKLTDEMVIAVPAQGDKGPQAGENESVQVSGEGMEGAGGAESQVNVNTADAEELQKLPGIGPAKAAAIISYRQQHGLFKKVDDLYPM
ncbi:helix-hairpin-helix domain-containing protein [Terrilactibacillus sp. S3-3]|nr:helix-hairpin-helix domain-containing protein [Terrilactibacillus sp. S3-3]